MKDNRHKIKYKKKCVICGKEFGAWNANQKFCNPECKHTSMIKNGEVYRERQRKKAERQAKNKNPTQALIDVAEEARKAGMTYGKYVAMMGL